MSNICKNAGNKINAIFTTMFIIFWDILIDEEIFFSPQAKRSLIISNKHDVYDLLQELPNNLKT